MTRRCSHCSNNGHNSRTCPSRGVKLFGVRLTDGSSIRKSASMGSLSLLAGSSGGASPAEGPEAAGVVAEGYTSEDFVPGSSSSCRERKKSTPWTEEEHRMFLLGLKNLGKGDWRGISRNFVVTRTPTQVASHAQKYFIRQTNMTKRKRRSSLFDIVPDEMKPLEPQTCQVSCQEDEVQSCHPLPVPPSLDEECESMDSNNSAVAETAAPQSEALQCSYYPVIVPAYYCLPYMQLPLPPWSGYEADTSEQHAHEIVKPTARHSKTPINVDELVGILELSIGDHARETSSAPSVDLLSGSGRQSAFHANTSTRAPT